MKFGSGGSLEQHGFARNKLWAIDDDPPPLPSNDSVGKSFVDLLLKPSEEDLKFWPHRHYFELILRFRITILFKFVHVNVCWNSCLCLTVKFYCSFEFRLRISLASGGNLTLISRVRNINDKPFSFSFAYHTYLSVSDIRYESISHISIMVWKISICFLL